MEGATVRRTVITWLDIARATTAVRATCGASRFVILVDGFENRKQTRVASCKELRAYIHTDMNYGEAHI